MKMKLAITAFTAVALTALLTLAGPGCASNLPSAGTVTGTNAAPAAASTGFIQVNAAGLLVVGGFTVDTNEVYDAIQSATELGASLAEQSDTNSIAYFRAVYTVLQVALDNGQYDPTNLTASLNAISINEVKDSTTVKAAVTVGLTLYKGFFGKLVTAGLTGPSASPYLAPALAALRDGIGSVLPAT